MNAIFSSPHHCPAAGRPAVAVIGGGFTGAAIAFHLANALPAGAADILVFEPRPALGAGLAYGANDPAHRINVPATKMNLFPEDEGHFARWLASSGELAADPDAVWPDAATGGAAFPRRAAFGRYIAAHLAPLLESGRVRWIPQQVASVTPSTAGDAGPAGRRWRIVDAAGAVFDADLTILAASHPPPAPPAPALHGLAGHPGFIADPTAPGALDRIASDDRVLIMGCGLTMADIVATLDQRRHRGLITAFSRRGQRSLGHAPAGTPEYGDFAVDPSRSARTLLARVQRTLDDAAAAGLPWQSVFDVLRRQGGDIWAALDWPERRRLVRHLRVYWDARRFRIAPQVDEALRRLEAAGQLEILAASLVSATVTAAGARIVLRPRRGGGEIVRHVDVAVAATGPAHGAILQTQPLLAELAAAGRLIPDPAGLGLACNRRGHAIGDDGAADPSLIIAGPLARGTFGELMGLPEVSVYARAVALEVAGQIGASLRSSPV